MTAFHYFLLADYVAVGPLLYSGARHDTEDREEAIG
jgi:hypothetical protein